MGEGDDDSGGGVSRDVRIENDRFSFYFILFYFIFLLFFLIL